MLNGREKQNKSNTTNWGFYAHKRINRQAIFTLPPEMFGFYKEHMEYLTEHAVDSDKRRYAMEGEAQRHYIDIDHYVTGREDPFEKMPRKWEEAVAKFTEDTLQAYGIIPWHLKSMKFKLQSAFEKKNVDLILKYSADIGHYIGDAHVPLHTTENYNGQLTNQKGIHGLWESRLVEINSNNYDYFVGKAQYINSIEKFIWETIKASHQAVDSVLRIEQQVTDDMKIDTKYSFEERGNKTVRVYSYEFSEAYHSRMNGMVERRLRASIQAIASFWYTAWIDAGQPDLSILQNTPPSMAMMEELKALDLHYEKGKHKGRICE